MKKKFFFVFEYKYNEIYHKRFNIAYLSKFYDLLIIDLSNIFSKQLKKNIKRLKKKTLILQNLEKFENIISEQNPQYVALNGSESFKKKIGMCVEKFSPTSKIIEFYNGPTPFDVPYYNNYAIKKIFLSFKLIQFFPILLKKIFTYFFRIPQLKKNFFYCTHSLFYSGRETLQMKLFEKKKIKHFIQAPSFDHDESLRTKNNNRLLNIRYAVFIDSMIMHHDDYKSQFKDIPVSKYYFKEINNYFSFLENRLNLKIIIALHPTCHIKNYSQFFNQRICIQHKTVQLIKNAEFVILHASGTAINFAVIYKKPVIYLTSDELNNSYTYYKRRIIREKIFNKKFVNISNKLNNYDYAQILNINQKAYKEYFRSFINSSRNKNEDLSKLILKNLK